MARPGPPGSCPTLVEAGRLQQSGQLAAAAALYRDWLVRKPRDADALLGLGTLLIQAGDHTQAAEILERADRARPADGRILRPLAHALACSGQAEKALQRYDAALVFSPRAADLHFERAGVLKSLGRLAEACQSLEQAVACRPDFPEACNNLGNLWWERQQLDQARRTFEALTRQAPQFAAGHANLGAVCLELRDAAAALSSLDKALALDPTLADAHSSRGNALLAVDRPAEALASFDRAVALHPKSAEIHWNRSLCLLRLGRYPEGWQEHEWRAATRQLGAWYPRLSRPLWLGSPELAGRTLLIVAEQGLGDSLQFCRYATLAAAAGAKVVLAVQAPLVGLLRRLDGVTQVIAPGEAIPPYDCYCPMMSLPLAFGTTLDSVPAPARYLSPPPEKARNWQDRLGTPTTLRVGLVWAGGARPDQPEAMRVDALRSIPLAEFAALHLPGIEFHSLQKGDPVAQLDALRQSGWAGPDIVAHHDELHDFTDTAALADQLDLVISVDTSVAHLAGALGKPVWLLNRHNGCWRWLLDREDSPWYPSLRIFRQAAPGTWSDVMASVGAALAQLAADGSRSERAADLCRVDSGPSTPTA